MPHKFIARTNLGARALANPQEGGKLSYEMRNPIFKSFFVSLCFISLGLNLGTQAFAIPTQANQQNKQPVVAVPVNPGNNQPVPQQQIFGGSSPLVLAANAAANAVTQMATRQVSTPPAAPIPSVYVALQGQVGTHPIPSNALWFSNYRLLVGGDRVNSLAFQISRVNNNTILVQMVAEVRLRNVTGTEYSAHRILGTLFVESNGTTRFPLRGFLLEIPPQENLLPANQGRLRLIGIGATQDAHGRVTLVPHFSLVPPVENRR